MRQDKSDLASGHGCFCFVLPFSLHSKTCTPYKLYICQNLNRLLELAEWRKEKLGGPFLLIFRRIQIFVILFTAFQCCQNRLTSAQSIPLSRSTQDRKKPPKQPHIYERSSFVQINRHHKKQTQLLTEKKKCTWPLEPASPCYLLGLLSLTKSNLRNALDKDSQISSYAQTLS